VLAATDALALSWLACASAICSEQEMDEIASHHGIREGFGVVIVEVARRHAGGALGPAGRRQSSWRSASDRVTGDTHAAAPDRRLANGGPRRA